MKKILIVDDNPVILKIMTRLLEKEGHEVSTAKDGYSALNILVGYVPDIIFVDLFMPKIGGDKLCHIIRKMPHLQDVYLVIISAAFSEMDMDHETLPADHYHCAELAVGALYLALADCRQTRRKPWQKLYR